MPYYSLNAHVGLEALAAIRPLFSYATLLLIRRQSVSVKFFFSLNLY
jgi:hypothetical protein